MSRLRSVVFIWLALVCGLAAASASAQGEGNFPEFSQLPGLETVVSRDYELDFSQFEAEEAGATPAEFRDAFFFAGMVLEFGDATDAAAGYQVMLEHGVSNLVASFGMDNPEIEEVPLADLGDQAVAFSVFNATGSTEGYVRQTLMQEANYVFVAVIITEAEESSLDADALVAHFSEQVSSAPTGVGTVDPAGGSTDGLWDFYPAADHPLYAGLILDGDDVLFPTA